MKKLISTVFCAATICLCVGCDTKEEVLDIETPDGGVEVEESDDGVSIDIQTDGKDGDSLNIDIPKPDEDPQP